MIDLYSVSTRQISYISFFSIVHFEFDFPKDWVSAIFYFILYSLLPCAHNGFSSIAPEASYYPSIADIFIDFIFAFFLNF